MNYEHMYMNITQVTLDILELVIYTKHLRFT
jgi:hypothetical protein